MLFFIEDSLKLSFFLRPPLFLHMQQTEAAVERVFRARPSGCASLCPVQRHSAENSDVLTCKRRRTGSRFPNALIRSSVAAEKKKKNENAASTKIVVLVVMQYLKENNSKVVLAVVPGANGRRKWRWSFSHSDKRSHNEGTDCVIMAGAAPSPCSGDEQHKRHI